MVTLIISFSNFDFLQDLPPWLLGLLFRKNFRTIFALENQNIYFESYFLRFSIFCKTSHPELEALGASKDAQYWGTISRSAQKEYNFLHVCQR